MMKDMKDLWTGDMLATAGDDGNVLLWVPSESRDTTFGHDDSAALEDKEFWRCKLMCRSMGSEIYDIAWSPDSNYILTGSMDNIARIYDARDGRDPGELVLISCRTVDAANSGTQPLRSRRDMGPSK